MHRERLTDIYIHTKVRDGGGALRTFTDVYMDLFILAFNLKTVQHLNKNN